MKTIFEKKWNIEDFAKTYTFKGPNRNGVATDIVKCNMEKYGVDEYLEKPFENLKAVESKIHSLLNI